MKCRFIDEETHLLGHKVRLLEIECDNGYIGQIYVTKKPAFQINNLNTWHYDMTGNKITLTGIGNNSVKFMGESGELCHVTITNVPVEDI